jgi:hypothetical protein
LKRGITAIFGAVSANTLNGYVFVQEPGKACFWCFKPDMPVQKDTRCYQPAVVYSHTAVIGIATYAAVRLIMGQELGWNCYDVHLDSDSMARTVPMRQGCKICGGGAE